MNKVGRKIITYFIIVNSIVLIICFILSSTILSRIYLNDQFKLLKGEAQNISSNLKNNTLDYTPSYNSVLYKDGEISTFGKGKMNFLKNIENFDYNSINIQGEYRSKNGEKFLYYKLKTDYGIITVFKNGDESSSYINIINKVLLLIFIISIIITIPLIFYIGKKITKPILKLKEASILISQGNFDVDIKVDTKDEIEDLSLELSEMANKLQKRDSIQREFMANVSHDFKTPLSIIRNNTEAIYDDLLDTEEVKEYSKNIIEEVDHLNQMVLTILELSKLQDGKIPLKNEWFPLESVIQTACRRFYKIAEEKEIDIIFNTTNYNIYGDYNLILRVLNNLIDNGIKFTKIGRISILVREEKELIVEVTDTGKGISEEELNNIWWRYYKDKSSGGMGLGLAICKEILDRHGFPLKVRSTLGTGSTFFFIIPEGKYK